MEGSLVWMLFLPLLLLDPGSQEPCKAPSENVTWTEDFKEDVCLNFSGQGRTLPQNLSLRASNLRVLDLSRNHLQQLPLSFFVHLEKLQVLHVVDNPLVSVDADLGARCELDLRADCSCVLKAWYKVRRDNCSDQSSLSPQCLHAGGWGNLSTFLEDGCGPLLRPATIGAVVTGGVLLLVIAVVGPVLAWRLRRRRAARNQDLRKACAAHDGPRIGTAWQPRYSSRGQGAKPQVPSPNRPSTPDYENMFVGLPPAQYQGADHREEPLEDNGCYMNYRDLELASQPVYCYLQSLGRAPLDDEEYVIPGR
ncbi:leucine-rich repeat-containing protein 25 [Tupaia chinensis]|uniref:Leucine-rich repeat-containing protein 25 n=1 Tax=Tupaia chinensis TaxID=246437 RepID=L9KWG3_TUPCH|nr:leucine-rich repeat-containing protein 25 [Tupaia chinensis]XP_027627096.1 leucine-rich repeat-containing protein 25 [Tupaia chinensis]ELW67151.1 Leucine-rich repeat-containing protein 25 [Tupaia chinensis]